MPKILTRQQIEQYHDEGFISPVRVISAVEALSIKAELEEVEEIPRGSRVVFSAHGSPPSDFQKAKERDLKVVDATCPLVIKVHNEAKKY